MSFRLLQSSRAKKRWGALAPRFWSRVDKSNDCWIWTGAVASGYGACRYKGKQTTAHRVAYELEVGLIPTGLVVMHRCDNPLCVKPDHLVVGTQSENLRDMVAKGRYGGDRSKNTPRNAKGQFTIKG